MIASLEGKLEHRGTNSIVVGVGGIGFQVYVPSSTLARLGAIGGTVFLHTHLHLKDDNASIYGFASSEELSLFRNLISVSGVGPKVALALLSALNPDQLVTAIASGDVALISQAPGIGRKVASRLVVELRGSLEKEWGAMAPPLAPGNADAVAALTSLGFSLAEATKAVSNLPDSKELSLEDRVMMALQRTTNG